MPVPYADLQLQYQNIKGEIDAAIADVIRDNAFIRGPYVDAFEREFAAAAVKSVAHTAICGKSLLALLGTSGVAPRRIAGRQPLRS